MTVEIVPALARWLHFMAGIMWVGLLYYFNFVQVAALKAATADGTNVGIARHVAPRALLYFRWAAVVTWLAGAALLGIDDKGRMAMSGVDVPDPWGLSTDVVLGRRPSSAELEPTSSTWGPTCRWRAGPRSYGPAHLVAP